MNVARAPRKSVVSLALLLVAGALACKEEPGTARRYGGGGGGTYAPILANLGLSPSSAAVNDGGGFVSVAFHVDVTDPDADVVRMAVTLVDPAGEPMTEERPISSPPGLTHGRVDGQIALSTAAVEVYTLRFQVFDAGGRASNLVETTFPVLAANPVPALTSLSPSSANAGTASVRLTATGTDFVPSSVVLWDGSSLTTTYVDATTLEAEVPSYLLAAPATVAVAVRTPAPGGGTTTPRPFDVIRPAQPGVTLVDLVANDLAWDPYRRKLYASVGSLAPLHPNAVAVVDPFTGAVVGAQFAGSEPGRLALSDDGAFLYVALGGASSVSRLTVPGLVQDLSIPLGRDPNFGAYFAGDLQVAPSSPRALAVSLVTSGGILGGLVVFDDAAARPTREPGYSGHYFNSIQWGSSASTLYAANGETTGFDLYVLSVDASGVVLTKDYAEAFSGFGNAIRFDPGTGLVYGSGGRVVDPATGLTVGTYPAAGYWQRSMVPDSSLGSAFFATGDGGFPSTTVRLQAFHLTSFYPTRSTDIPVLQGEPRRLVRWGPDGVAFIAGRQIVLARGPTVLPESATDNPAPSATSLAPMSATAGGGNFTLTVTGSGFVPGSVVRWDGGDRTTRFVSSTELVAYIPASDLAVAGTPAVTVTSPLPGGGTSAAVTFTVL